MTGLSIYPLGGKLHIFVSYSLSMNKRTLTADGYRICNSTYTQKATI